MGSRDNKAAAAHARPVALRRTLCYAMLCCAQAARFDVRDYIKGEEGREAEAAAALAAALQAYPACWWMAMVHARYLFETKQDAKAALAEAERALRHNPLSVDARLVRTHLLHVTGAQAAADAAGLELFRAKGGTPWGNKYLIRPKGWKQGEAAEPWAGLAETMRPLLSKRAQAQLRQLDAADAQACHAASSYIHAHRPPMHPRELEAADAQAREEAAAAKAARMAKHRLAAAEREVAARPDDVAAQLHHFSVLAASRMPGADDAAFTLPNMPPTVHHLRHPQMAGADDAGLALLRAHAADPSREDEGFVDAVRGLLSNKGRKRWNRERYKDKP
jgi:hypothetical protein